MGSILTPPVIINIKKPFIFLAGPIQGALDWQAKAIEYFQEKNNNINIANPRRETIEQEFDFQKQVDWESFYLKKASKKGIILFWLEKEAHHNCLRAYGQTSRFELGEWIHLGKNPDHHLVVGIHDKFPGKKYLQYRIERDYPFIQVINHFDQVCEFAYHRFCFFYQ